MRQTVLPCRRARTAASGGYSRHSRRLSEVAKFLPYRELSGELMPLWVRRRSSPGSPRWPREDPLHHQGSASLPRLLRSSSASRLRKTLAIAHPGRRTAGQLLPYSEWAWPLAPLKGANKVAVCPLGARHKPDECHRERGPRPGQFPDLPVVAPAAMRWRCAKLVPKLSRKMISDSKR